MAMFQGVTGMVQITSYALFIVIMGSGVGVQTAPAEAAEAETAAVAAAGSEKAPREVPFTARFTPEELRPLLDRRSEFLPLPFQLDGQAELYGRVLDRISMDALVEEMRPFLAERFAGRFDPRRDVIFRPVPPERQVEMELPASADGQYRGPEQEIIGFLLHDVTRQEFLSVAGRALQQARQLLDSGDPAADRTSGNYYQLLASREVARLQDAQDRSEAEARAREAARREIGAALGVYDPQTGTFGGEPNWAKESRRYSYVIREGEFVERLRPLVTRMNRDVTMAGFRPPPELGPPGIQFDPDLEDVEIVLPRPLLESFLEQADQLERRMAEEELISIEAVRLTDRDILTGAIASRLNVVSQGVHDVNRMSKRGIFRDVGINSLLAVANRELAIVNLQEIEAGRRPEGTPPITLPPPTLPPVETDRTWTNIGSTFSAGADDIFFDGREQSYGFSYIGPDGLQHTLALDVVDSLREFWDRIERNLIVHKIKKTPKPERFTVPVGPETRSFEGIAALISQENQEIVVATATGAISTLQATAGTWLVIQDFRIEPLPGSSTTLTAEELSDLGDRVLLTMFLRDPLVEVETKSRLVEAGNREDLRTLLGMVYAEQQGRPVRPGWKARTYAEVYNQRVRDAAEDAGIEKKERNSKIIMTFYSSQGNIIQQPGVTALGDANDLTSFTTELRPNVVTPISSFFTKTASGATGSSPLTGISKGEQSSEEKTMTHLVVRARFPTMERERKDREEGRHLGYFDLPLGRRPQSMVDLPFMSSSDHPLERLSHLRVGMMFDALQQDRVQSPFELINPNSLRGTVSRRVWETATTRLLMNRKIISESPAVEQALATEFRQRFIIEVRSLLEYDEDFFAAPNMALRNMAQWNNPDRIVLALNNSNNRFPLHRLIGMIDELGERLVTDAYAEDYLGVSPSNLLGHYRVHPLSPEELKALRRDVANHYMRYQEIYGDAFLEAVSDILQLGTYRASRHAQLLEGPFRGYHDLVVFDHSGHALAASAVAQDAHEEFLIIKRGGIPGGMWGGSLRHLGDMYPDYRRFVVRGREVLKLGDWWALLNW
jgi:hypothetical protein